MAGDNVTFKIVGYCAATAVVALVIGGWMGDSRANDSRHDAELATLRQIASDFRAMVGSMETRVRALEDWRTGLGK